ncbi:MAG: 4Fe-4S dicluster domain-containing protein [Puniceicoccales bacterium]|nr:4Fe-4S dicluster domain-containing protein [Puniceicoccales bacterium]
MFGIGIIRRLSVSARKHVGSCVGSMPGAGILRGFRITARNLIGSYVNKAARLTTIQYPEEPARIPQNYRNYPFLVLDDTTAEGGLRCIACGMCERECPPKCIYIVKEVVKKNEGGKVSTLTRPKVFDIDISVCMGCGICVEVCPFESIKMDQHFEVAATNRFEGLLLRKEQLSKPNAYYHKIHPDDAARSDLILAGKRRKEELAASARAAAPGPAPGAPGGAGAAMA